MHYYASLCGARDFQHNIIWIYTIIIRSRLSICERVAFRGCVKNSRYLSAPVWFFRNVRESRGRVCVKRWCLCIVDVERFVVLCAGVVRERWKRFSFYVSGNIALVCVCYFLSLYQCRLFFAFWSVYNETRSKTTHTHTHLHACTRTNAHKVYAPLTQTTTRK